MPVYTPSIGSRRVAFSPGCANGHLQVEERISYEVDTALKSQDCLAGLHMGE